MAFMVTYHSLSKNNIRNLYSGLPEEINLRVSTAPSLLTPQQRIHEKYRCRSPEQRFLRERYLEYDSENHIRVPRAPAFRQMPRSEVDKMVIRLCEPTVSKRRRASDICEREVKRSFIEKCRKCRAFSARPSVNREQADQITARLLVPTMSASVRRSASSLRGETGSEGKLSCDKCALGPSGRFARDFHIYNV
ncbi:uncharacterized protein LOC128223153 [Mya arenaria]|uniref:uncharacterized protein LOC128223153 n=1 Tax=Mya arenaria TaxID=6604 RepID=UPI0022E83973|nr:uncharacterized protein LOC128223153 [Mya arenaria]